MLKGTQKRMVVIHPPKNDCYEVVYFVLRNEATPQQCTQAALLREANRILCEGAQAGRPALPAASHSRMRSALFGLAGMLFGALAVGLPWLFTALG